MTETELNIHQLDGLEQESGQAPAEVLTGNQQEEKVPYFTYEQLVYYKTSIETGEQAASSLEEMGFVGEFQVVNSIDGELLLLNGKVEDRLEENKSLVKQVIEGKKVLNDYATANQGLVRFLVKKYVRPDIYLNELVPFDDLVQAGNIGLLQAIRTYNPDYISQKTGERVQFSTYAASCIRPEILRAVVDLIRPQAENMYDGMSRSVCEAGLDVLEIIDDFVSENDRRPTIEEIIFVYQFRTKFGDNRFFHGEVKDTIDEDMVRKTLWFLEMESLDNIKEEAVDDTSMDKILMKVAWTAIEPLIAKLSDREKRAIVGYYCDGLTQKEIGQEFNITGERIRQHIQDAKDKLNCWLARDKLTVEDFF
ncbi:sigma-70 family RNA polymerase sigma factor [Patescibacteria group bacterium]